MYDAIDDVRVAPLVETSWGQGVHLVQGAYNYYTPNHYVCGCVATAGAQIMRYWRFPTGAVAFGRGVRHQRLHPVRDGLQNGRHGGHVRKGETPLHEDMGHRRGWRVPA